jgi:hypothetical protein
MRLIEELLKDDFFHGGYQPGAATAVTQANEPASEGRKKTFVLAAGIAIAVLALGGGAAYFVLGKKAPATAEAPADAQKLAAVIPPAPPAPVAPEPVSQVAAAAPVSHAAETTVAVDAPTQAEVEATEALAETPAAQEAAAPVEAPAPTPAPAVAEPKAKAAPAPKFTLVFPKTTDKAAVDKLLAELKSRGISATTKQGSESGSVYKVVGVKPVPVAEANAVKLKASLFKIPANSSDNGDGTVSFDFGTYATPEEAKKAAGDVKKLGIDIKLGRLTREIPAYTVTSAQLSQAEAEKVAGDLTVSGFDASVKKVP